MRLLVACGECKRQYDASGREIGSRFHCHCGNAVTVSQPRGHDADVVRCSGCGAPRETGARACGFCHSDFTLHERDLHTVCPGCMARISDRAKFCHHCGLAVNAELAEGKETPLNCPGCEPEQHMTSRLIGSEKITVMECGQCAGLWIGNETFERLVSVAKKDGVGKLGEFAAKSVAVLKQPPGGWKYRKCPVCESMMQRRNYGRRSGVIVDLCRDDGIWFDAEELPRILAWVRRGGLAVAERHQKDAKRADRQTREIANMGTSTTRAPIRSLGEPGHPKDGFDVLSSVLWAIFGD